MELVRYFGAQYEPPWMSLPEAMESAPDDVQSLIEVALAGIRNEQLEAVPADEQRHYEFLYPAMDATLRSRLQHLAASLSTAVETTRMSAVTARSPAASLSPYDHPALRGIRPDDEGLVQLSEFEQVGDALVRNGHAFFMLPPVSGSNACYWLLEKIAKHALVERVRVRLDPLLFGPADELRGRFYRMDVYGRPLDWDRISALREVDHGRWMPGKMSRRSFRTDYAWVPHDGEVDFLCEEVPLEEELNTRGSRYCHAIYNKGSACIAHIDGAIRVYEPSDWRTRISSHVHVAGKLGRRIKVFRTDQGVSRECLGDLVQAFFVWNYDVARYFGAPVPEEF